MKLYVSADIEGVAGITTWDEARKSSPDYGEFRRQMTREVAAACEGALAAGAEAITVKDAHGTARNLVAGELPAPTRLIRGWSGHPFGMVQELDGTYDAAVFVGYHARAGAGGNPLAHTMSSRLIQEVRINGTPASEYRIHALAAATVGVPVVFVSGDRTLCEEVGATCPATRTFATKWGEGPSQHSLHPQEALDGIREGVRSALRECDRSAALLQVPARFELEVLYKEHTVAFAKSFFPGAKAAGAHSVRFESDDYFEVLRALMFLI
jgi:D-amino peptidase